MQITETVAAGPDGFRLFYGRNANQAAGCARSQAVLDSLFRLRQVRAVFRVHVQDGADNFSVVALVP